MALACQKEERFVSVYSVKTGEMLCEMKRSPDIATALTCSPEGNFLLVGDETGSIELYRVGD